jgi:hypothetical protein
MDTLTGSSIIKYDGTFCLRTLKLDIPPNVSITYTGFDVSINDTNIAHVRDIEIDKVETIYKMFWCNNYYPMSNSLYTKDMIEYIDDLPYTTIDTSNAWCVLIPPEDDGMFSVKRGDKLVITIYGFNGTYPSTYHDYEHNIFRVAYDIIPLKDGTKKKNKKPVNKYSLITTRDYSDKNLDLNTTNYNRPRNTTTLPQMYYDGIRMCRVFYLSIDPTKSMNGLIPTSYCDKDKLIYELTEKTLKNRSLHSYSLMMVYKII